MLGKAILNTLLFCVCFAIMPDAVAQEAIARQDTVYGLADEMPVFNGDVSTYMSDSLRYPDSARMRNEQGRSIIRFVVTKAGHIDSVRVGRSSGSAFLDNEAIRFVSSMPDWKPGKVHGTPVSVYFFFPVNFILDDPMPEHSTGNERIVSCTTDPNDTTTYTEVNRRVQFLFNIQGFLGRSLIYPDIARRAGTGGTVIHRIVVDQRGYFKTVELHKSSGNPWLDRAADDAMLTLLNLNKSRYPPCMPAIRDGKCVRSEITFPTIFRDPSIRQQESGLTRNLRRRY